jgi:hypothetical protein
MGHAGEQIDHVFGCWGEFDHDYYCRSSADASDGAVELLGVGVVFAEAVGVAIEGDDDDRFRSRSSMAAATVLSANTSGPTRSDGVIWYGRAGGI